MSELINKPELAEVLREYLQQQADQGKAWVVYDVDHPITSQWDLHCFPQEHQAVEFEQENQQIWNWHMAFPLATCFMRSTK